MSDMIAQFTAFSGPLLFFATMCIILLLRRNARKAAPSTPIGIAADGTMTVPVRGIYLRRAGILGGATNNSINPRFTIAPDGIHYRVFREGWLPFSSIDHVEVREWLGSVYLLLLNNAGPRLLSVDVRDRGTAKGVLNALPSTVKLTPEVATIRDGAAGAGTSGLRLYHGRFA